MLRTKQLGTLSHCARSFFLSGSRSGASDGASCTCSEDENCISKRQSTNIDIQSPQKAPSVVSKTTPGAEGTLSRDATGPVSYKTESCGYLVSIPHILSARSSSLKSDCNAADHNIHAAQQEVGHSSMLVTEHLVKAGIATVGFLSDLVNHRIPTLDGSGILVLQNGMVNSTRPVSNINSSYGKVQKAADSSEAQSKPSADAAGGSRYRSHRNDAKGKEEKPRQARGLQHISTTATQDRSLASDRQNRRRSVSRREKSRSSGMLPTISSNGRMSEGKVAVAIPESIRSVDKVHQPMIPMRRMHPGPAISAGYEVDKVQQPMRSRLHSGGAPSSSPYVTAGRTVDHVYHILRHAKWGPAAEDALRNLSGTLDAYQANQILKLLQDDSVALGFFYWLKRQDGFRHDEHTYTTMVGILGRVRQFGAIRRLLDEMIRDGCQPNVVTYNRLIHSYGRANYMDEAMNIFYQMQKVGCQPDRVTYCTLIDIHAKAGYLEVAMDLFRRMQEAGLSPDTFTYGVIINCLGKAGHLSAAYKLFCEMVAHGCIPNLVTYNIMIALQAKARNYPSALKLYRDMRTAGFKPDKVTYSIVMEVLGHCGCLDEAEAVFAEMKREDWVPDEPAYGLLVDLWGKAGNVDKAQGWYQSMLDAGLRPNVPTCNSLLSAFLRAHRFSDAHNVLQSMLSLGLHPSLQTYTLLLSCCTDVCSHGDMGICCELMATTGHPAHAFLLTMPAAGPDGQNVRDHATNFLDLMHSENRESKRGLVDAVIDFLHKSGLKEEAGSVWEVAAMKNVYPDAVREKRASYWLINLHVMSEGTAVTALSRTLAWFRRRMLELGIAPNRIDIVTGWGKRSRVTGSSMVRQSVQELLLLFRFPFFTEYGNSGCFVGCGEPLNQWLLHSYVERMHLL